MPHATKRDLGILVDAIRIAVLIYTLQYFVERMHIRCGEIETFRSRWWNDMRRIPDQEQFSVLHRFADKRSQRSDALFYTRASNQYFGRIRRQPSFEFGLELVV